jgi:DegV family protein with EDD domain
MSEIAICTDSSALFPAGGAEQLGITVVPIAITLDDAPFDERGGATDYFYSRLSEGARVTTSQPSPGEFLEAYGRMAERGAREVLSIHLDARVSGTATSAELAAREAPIPVTVVDTRTVSFGVGVCIRAAAATIATGAPAREAAAAATRTGTMLRNAFVAPAGPGGRLSETSAWAVLEFADGKPEPHAACDGLAEAIEIMTARAIDADGATRAAVGHAAVSTRPAADALALSLARLSHVVEVERYRVAPAVGAHTGGSSFGAFWWPSS